jgi:uncharacterized protein YkwD
MLHIPKTAALRYITLSLISTAILAGITLGSVKNHQISAAPLESSIESQLIQTTNEQRIRAGLTPLKWNPALYSAANAKAADMLQKQYFDHIAPDGTTPWMFIRQAYSYESAGENLAIDFHNPSDAVPAWMDSPSHRANLLDKKFRDTGVAVVQGSMNGKLTTIIVQMFGEQNTFVK